MERHLAIHAHTIITQVVSITIITTAEAIHPIQTENVVSKRMSVRIKSKRMELHICMSFVKRPRHSHEHCDGAADGPRLGSYSHDAILSSWSN